MSRTVTHTERLTKLLSSYDNVDHSYYSISNVSNAYTGLDPSSRCQIYLTRGEGAYTYVYFKFDTSSIPEDASIDSISCIAKVAMQSAGTSYVSRGVKACSGTVEKSSAGSISQNAARRTLAMGTWTRDEVRDVRIKMYATRTGNYNTSYYIALYSAQLVIDYSWNEYFYDVTGSSNSSSITFSGDGEYSSGDNVTVTITGDLTGAVVTDNGVDVTSSLSGSGTTHTYTISGIAADHAIVVTFPSTGQEIFVKQNGAWVAVDTVYVKQNGVWSKVENLSIKQNGSWVN